MRVTINGQSETIEDGITVATYLERAGLVRHALRRRDQQATHPQARARDATIQEGDAIEVVTLVGGG